VVMDLRQGFRLPEGELLLANSRETQIPLLLDPARPVQRINVNRPRSTPAMIRPDIQRANRPHHAGKWTKTRSTIRLKFPKTPDQRVDGRQILPLVFEWVIRAPPRFGSDFSGGGRISRASPRVWSARSCWGAAPPCHLTRFL
jgi:hypothetical protein